MRYSCLILCLWAVSAGGCEHLSALPMVSMTDEGRLLSPPMGRGLVASQRSPVPDVPMPVGFKPVTNRCEHTFDGSVRTVHHVYQGVAGNADTLTFYRQHLPMHHWEQLLIEANGRTTTFTATKRNEALRIEIRQKYGITTLILDISPR